MMHSCDSGVGVVVGVEKGVVELAVSLQSSSPSNRGEDNSILAILQLCKLIETGLHMSQTKITNNLLGPLKLGKYINKF